MHRVRSSHRPHFRLFIVQLVLGSWTAAASAQSVTASGDHVNLRTRPQVAAAVPVLRQARRGEQLPLLEEQPEDGFYLVQLPDKRSAWISTTYAHIESTAAAVAAE